MRSYENMCEVKNKLKKVRRKRVSWFEVLVKVQDDIMRKYFNSLFTAYRDRKHGSHLSMNRAAYCTLRHFYSTTTIEELCEKVGIL